jgi:hypothetical protein
LSTFQVYWKTKKYRILVLYFPHLFLWYQRHVHPEKRQIIKLLCSVDSQGGATTIN